MNKKLTVYYILLLLLISNLCWYLGFQARQADERSIGAVLFLALAAFSPAILALIFCRTEKKSFWTLNLHPHIKQAYRVYLLAIIVGVALVFATDLLPLVFFRNDVTFAADKLTPTYFATVLGVILLCVVESVEMLGEELGWMGYLFPRLETRFGTIFGAVLLAVVRTLYHATAIFLMEGTPEKFFASISYLFLNNLCFQGILIFITKASRSVFPAGIVHALTNVLPVVEVLTTFSDGFDETTPYRLVTLIPCGILGAVFYGILWKMGKTADQTMGNEKI